MSDNRLYPLVFEPIFKEVIWGGRKLATLGKQLPDGSSIGESWELCDLPGEQSVVSNGGLAGMSLSDVIRSDQAALMGNVALDGGRFPLLVKFIDAAATLSVQVHPDEAACARLGEGRPKNEAWYVVDVEPDAALYLGLRSGVDQARFVASIADGSIETLLREVKPAAGELYPIFPGTLHAIGAGLLIAEVQQPSDTTYRVYDWGRVGFDGKPRQLHVEQAIACTRVDAEVKAVEQTLDAGHFLAKVEALASGREIDVRGSGCRVLVGLEGEVVIHSESPEPQVALNKGVVALLPASVEKVRLEAKSAARVMTVEFP